MCEDLIRPFVPALRRYAWGLSGNGHDADDLVQDCLVRALEAWPTRRPDANLQSWLFAILYNGFVSDLRRSKRRLADAGEPSPLDAPQLDHAHLGDVGRALASLPDDQRALLLLIGVEDFSYLEAAEALGIPVGTKMSRLSRARQRLREALETGSSNGKRLRRVK